MTLLVAARKGLKVITSDTPGYRHRGWIVKYECRYDLVNQYGTVITTTRDIATAETMVWLQADQDTDRLEL